MPGFGDLLIQPINYKIYNNENAGELNVYWSNTHLFQLLEFTLEFSICCDFIRIQIIKINRQTAMLQRYNKVCK